MCLWNRWCMSTNESANQRPCAAPPLTARLCDVRSNVIGMLVRAQRNAQNLKLGPVMLCEAATSALTGASAPVPHSPNRSCPRRLLESSPGDVEHADAPVRSLLKSLVDRVLSKPPARREHIQYSLLAHRTLSSDHLFTPVLRRQSKAPAARFLQFVYSLFETSMNIIMCAGAGSDWAVSLGCRQRHWYQVARDRALQVVQERNLQTLKASAVNRRSNATSIPSQEQVHAYDSSRFASVKMSTTVVTGRQRCPPRTVFILRVQRFDLERLLKLRNYTEGALQRRAPLGWKGCSTSTPPARHPAARHLCPPSPPVTSCAYASPYVGSSRKAMRLADTSWDGFPPLRPTWASM